MSHKFAYTCYWIDMCFIFNNKQYFASTVIENAELKIKVWPYCFVYHYVQKQNKDHNFSIYWKVGDNVIKWLSSSKGFVVSF